MEEVGTGVAGQAEFGEHNELDLFSVGSLKQVNDLLGIECTVSNAKLRDSGGDTKETVGKHDVCGNVRARSVSDGVRRLCSRLGPFGYNSSVGSG